MFTGNGLCAFAPHPDRAAGAGNAERAAAEIHAASGAALRRAGAVRRSQRTAARPGGHVAGSGTTRAPGLFGQRPLRGRLESLRACPTGGGRRARVAAVAGGTGAILGSWGIKGMLSGRSGPDRSRCGWRSASAPGIRRCWANFDLVRWRQMIGRDDVRCGTWYLTAMRLSDWPGSTTTWASLCADACFGIGAASSFKAVGVGASQRQTR